METKRYVAPEQPITNVYCVKCKCWMYVGFAKKVEGGYICNDCLKEEIKDDNKGDI